MEVNIEMREIDCWAMACPQPVITVKQALEELKNESIRGG